MGFFAGPIVIKEILDLGKIKLGVIGAGLIWDLTHKYKLEKMKDIFEITAFSVRSEKSRNKLKNEFQTS